MAVTWVAERHSTGARPPAGRAEGRDVRRARAARRASRPAVRLLIDRVVLEDVTPGQRHRVGDALAAGLHALIGARGAPAGLLEQAASPALLAAIDLTPGDQGTAVGAKLAVAVYRALEAAGRPAQRGTGRERR
ncbi:MAG TPA: hypothetical protein VGF54_11925 [Streptosporangiaceae bacterium]|jgi:hypothetical protein